MKNYNYLMDYFLDKSLTYWSCEIISNWENGKTKNGKLNKAMYWDASKSLITSRIEIDVLNGIVIENIGR